MIIDHRLETKGRSVDKKVSETSPPALFISRVIIVMGGCYNEKITTWGFGNICESLPS